ncbi:hypothetical protein TRVL_05286 [Trypanosoma vivax]|nr:hypothetical protein TRVL_05286 [Trypanosoma vivax]
MTLRKASHLVARALVARPLGRSLHAVPPVHMMQCCQCRRRTQDTMPPRWRGPAGSGAPGPSPSNTPTPSPPHRRAALKPLVPPSPLSSENAVGFMAELRERHSLLGTSYAASSTRWQAREFLLYGMRFGAGVGDAWAMTKVLATAVVSTCTYFEVSVFECPYGRESVEFLWRLWEGEPPAASSPPCDCEAAAELGQLILNVVAHISSGAFRIAAADRAWLTRFLCETLLPSAFRFLRDGSLLLTHGAMERDVMSDVAASAFSLLLSSLAKAAIAGLATRGSTGAGEHVVVLCARAPQQWDCASRVNGTPVTVTPLPLAGLARLLCCYVHSLGSPRLRRTALQVLRFFTHTQCIPQLVAVQGMGENDVPAHVKSLVSSLTTTLTAAFDPSVTSVSHHVASVASTYARVLLFGCTAAESSAGDPMKTSTAGAVSEDAPLVVFNDIMRQLRDNVLRHGEPLSPGSALLWLCERVTPRARKYLFSDLAALLHALTRVYRVVREHCGLVSRQASALPGEGGCHAGAGAPPIRVAGMPTVGSAHTETAQWQPAAPPRAARSAEFAVGNEDIAEIEGELEVLMDACVAVMERYMPSFCKGRQVLVSQGVAGCSVPQPKTESDANDCEPTHCGDMQQEGGIGLTRIGASEAKALGGRSRLLKKTVAGRELLLIAVGVHSLSWRPFIAFQERLLGALSSEVGHVAVNSAHYVSLVYLLLRSSPVLSSIVFHAVEDRLKRLIFSDAVKIDVDVSLSFSDSEAIIASACARPPQDEQLSLFRSCHVVFALCVKLKLNALSLMNDLLVRCAQRVVLETQIDVAVIDVPTFSGLLLFVACCAHVMRSSCDYQHSSVQESSGAPKSGVISFISRAYAHATSVLSRSLLHFREANESFILTLSLRDVAFALLMFSKLSESDVPDLVIIVQLLRSRFLSQVSCCDDFELAQFLTEFVDWSSGLSLHSHDALVTEPTTVELSLESWMVASMELPMRFKNNMRLLSVVFFPFVYPQCGPDCLLHVLCVARRHCRTFSTLVMVLLCIRSADPKLLHNELVREFVLRKAVQVTRRTAQPLDLFIFFALYGDSVHMVMACLGELVPGARCFSQEGCADGTASSCSDRTQDPAPFSTPRPFVSNAFVPLVQVNAAVQAVLRLPSSALRQRWMQVLSPLIISAAGSSREPLDSVLELAELIVKSDPTLAQAVIMSSASMQHIDDTFVFSASGDTLLRLLLLLQGANLSNPIVRRLHAASRKVFGGGLMSALSLSRLAKAVLLPSLKGTVLGRRLRRVFLKRIGVLLRHHKSTGRFQRVVGLVSNEMSVKGVRLMAPEREKEIKNWHASLNTLELEHWLVILRYSTETEPTSYRFLMIRKGEQQTPRTYKPNSSCAEKTLASAINCGEQDAFVANDEGGKSTDSNSAHTSVEFMDRCCPGLALFYAFSEDVVSKFRQSLGASCFVAFVHELIVRSLEVDLHVPCSQSFVAQGQPHAACDTKLLYDGTVSPLSCVRVLPYIRLANELIEKMSCNLGAFLMSEKEIVRQTRQACVSSSNAVIIDLGAVLRYLRILDKIDAEHNEKMLLLLGDIGHGRAQGNVARMVQCDDLGVFDDSMGLSLRYLYRILLQLPQYWSTSSALAPDMICIRPTNISAVFEFCTNRAIMPGLCNKIADVSRVPAASGGQITLAEIFGSDRPSVLDVWLPMSEAENRQEMVDNAVKRHLFGALMRCFVREGESTATARARLAQLGPRDLAYIVQACLQQELCNSELGVGVHEMCALMGIELITEMLTGITDDDMCDVVRALVPLLGQARVKDPQNKREMEAKVRHFLAHVAIQLGSDTERFSLPRLVEMVQLLHVPHGLVSVAAAENMLEFIRSTHATADKTPSRVEDVEGMVDDEASGPGASTDPYVSLVGLLGEIISRSTVDTYVSGCEPETEIDAGCA